MSGVRTSPGPLAGWYEVFVLVLDIIYTCTPLSIYPQWTSLSQPTYGPHQDWTSVVPSEGKCTAPGSNTLLAVVFRSWRWETKDWRTQWARFRWWLSDVMSHDRWAEWAGPLSTSHSLPATVINVSLDDLGRQSDRDEGDIGAEISTVISHQISLSPVTLCNTRQSCLGIIVRLSSNLTLFTFIFLTFYTVLALVRVG